MRTILPPLVLALLAVASVSAEPAPGSELAFSLRSWEGEYFSKDISGGVETVAYTSVIHTIKTDGTSLRQVTKSGQIADAPAFSPDGRWLYFQAKSSGAYEVYR